MASIQLRPMTRTISSSCLNHMIFFAILPAAVAADGHSDSEFAFNVFTDLAPLLALFGEQFARQFMSESLTWLDHIVFAMAPLGIVTAIVGAIRVSGPAWARAFIGRARESRAAAEIELMSSTSREVCELFNGKGVVRAMGTPKMTQFILLPQQYREDDTTCGIHTLRTAYENTTQHIEKTKYAICDTSNAGSSISKDDRMRGEARKPEDQRQPASDPKSKTRWRKPWGRTMSKLCDPESGGNGKAASNYETNPDHHKDPATLNRHDSSTSENRGRERGHGLDKGATDKEPFPQKLKTSAPNLQLNLPRTLRSHRSSIEELKWAAATAFFIQLAVIVISAVTSYYPRTQKAVGPPQTRYGFWLFIAGTLCLDSGMILCSFVIERSTTEYVWHQRDRSKDPTQDVQTTLPITLVTSASETSRNEAETSTELGTNEKTPDKTQTANARQVNGPKSMDSDVQSCNKDSGLQLFWLQQKQTVNDQDFDPYLIHGGLKSEIVTSSRHDHQPRWLHSIAANKFEFFTVCASILGLVGFILQFEGLRGLAWPTAVSQLLAIFLVALMRAIIRRRLGKEPSTVPAQEGYEADWLALYLVYENYALDPEDGGTGQNADKDVDMQIPTVRWRILTRPDKLKEKGDVNGGTFGGFKPGRDPNCARIFVEPGVLNLKKGKGPLPWPEDPDQSTRDPRRLFASTSQVALKVRRRLGELTKCSGAASKEAIALAQAISLILNDLCPIEEDHTGTFTFYLDTIKDSVLTKTKLSLRTKSELDPDQDTSDEQLAKQKVGAPAKGSLALQVRGGRDGWQMYPPDIDAVMSLWMSAYPISPKIRRIQEFTDGARSVQDEEEDADRQSGGRDWLSVMASSTIKYRRILGEDPVVTTKPIRTDILRRDLNWWTSDPRISASHEEHTDPLDTGDVEIEIGFNGLNPDTRKAKTTEEQDRPEQGASKPSTAQVIGATSTSPLPVAVISFIANGPLATILAHHLFSAFMWALSYHIKEDSFDSATVEDAELFDGVDFKNTWNLATLRNKRMMKLARSISGFGIGPIDDVLLGMIPPLSYRGILPTQVMMSVLLRKPKSHEEYHEWGQAQNAYITLLTLSMNPRQPSMDRISYEVVVELIEFLFLANEAVKDSSNSKTSQEETQGKSDRPAKVGNQAKALAEAVSTVTKELRNHPLLSSVVEELRWFYQKQRRQHRFDKLFPTPETVQSRASADCDETPRQTESLTDDEGTFIEDSEARRSSVWRDENEVGNSHKQRKPDPRLKQLTKFSKYHESCIYAQDDPQSDAKFDQFCDQSGWADKSDIFGWYPLHYATVGDDKNLFEKMFDAYVKRDIQLHELRDKSGRTPLHYAAMYKPDRIKHFTGSNAEKARLAVNARGRGKTLPVHCAARYGNKVAIEELGKYSSGAAVDAFGRSALHLGVIASNLDAVRAFSKGDNATIQTGEELSRRTPLHFALMASDGKNAKNDVLKELMKREQDLKAIMIDDEYKETPIRLALRKEDDGFFEMLLRPFSKGPQRPLDGESKPSVVTSCFRQVFKDAISLEREQVLRLMFEHIIDVNHDWEPGWIEDAFAIAHRLLHVDMLNKMFKIVESMVAAAKVSSEYYDNLHKMFKNQESAVWIWAIQNGNLKFMEETLDKKTAGLHWNKKDSSNRSALAYIAKINRSFDLGAHRFSVQNRIRMFEILWHNWRSWTPRERERALNERQGSKSKTPLIYAVRNGFLELAQRFIAAGALSRGFDDHDMSAFTYALRETDEPWKELWKQMVDKDPEVVNECNRNYYSTTTLIEATRNGEREVVDFLSTCPNIDPNAQDTEGDTVLAWSYWQNASMTSTLMQKFPQLDPHLRNNKGSSPRMIAYTDAHYDELTPSVHDMFSGHGNRMREYEGTLMLSHAISRRNVDLVRFLLGAGADPCSTDDAGRSQIELTALRGNLELFKLLYDGGKVPEHQLKRVYHACIQRADTTSEQVLEELDRMKIALEPTDLDAHGWTVRDCAVYAENPQSLMKWPQLRHIQSEPSEKATRGESSSQHIPPSRWAVSADNPFFEVEGRLLKITSPFPERLRSRDQLKSRFMFRADHCIPLSLSIYYWELEIVDHSGGGIISMGVCCQNSDPYGHVGWALSAGAGYHSDDGCLFLNKGDSSLHKGGPTWDIGDIVGCLVEIRNMNRTVQFLHNRRKTGSALQLPKDMRGQLYPCVGLDARRGTEGTQVKATFGAVLPDFDRSSTTKDVDATVEQLQMERSDSSNISEGDQASQEDVDEVDQGSQTSFPAQLSTLGGHEADDAGPTSPEAEPVGDIPRSSSEQPAKQHVEKLAEDIAEDITHPRENESDTDDPLFQHEEDTHRGLDSGNDGFGDHVVDLRRGSEGDQGSQGEAAVHQGEDAHSDEVGEHVPEPQVDGALQEAHIVGQDLEHERDAVAGAEGSPE